MSTEVQRDGDFDYAKVVVEAGDDASRQFVLACNEANKGLPHKKLFEGNKITLGRHNISEVNIQTDGVGTKTEIYQNAFNQLYIDFKNNKFEKQAFISKASEMWRRMFCDLFAMNADDLRNGEICLGMTNVLNVTKIDGERGQLFTESFAKGMYQAIKDTQIRMIAGETAILGDGAKFSLLKNLVNDLLGKIETAMNGTSDISINPELSRIVADTKMQAEAIGEMIEIKSISGSSVGVQPITQEGNPKLQEQVEEGQVIIGFSEKPTENGILSPRSNGITTIRRTLKELAGEGWESLTFEEFCDKLGEQANKIPEQLKHECSGLRMWDIATGRTTVFNGFISNDILGGFEKDSKFGVSKLIHVTGGPINKIVDSLGENKEKLEIHLNLRDVKIPQIIQLIQILADIDDKKALESWNMGLPYAIICDNDKKDIEKIIKLAKAEGITAQIVGSIKKTKKKKKLKHSINGVGVRNSNLKFDKSKTLIN